MRSWLGASLVLGLAWNLSAAANWVEMAASGGGRALPAGASSIFHNPSADQGDDTWRFASDLVFPQAEQGAQMYGAFSFPSRNASRVALGFWEPSLGDFVSHGGALSASLHPFDGVTSSALATALRDSSGDFSLDLGLSAWFRASRHFQWSLTADNLLQAHPGRSQMGNPPGGFLGGKRHFALGSALYADSANRLGLFYDLEAMGTGTPGSMAHVAGLRAQIGPRNELALLAGARGDARVPRSREAWTGSAGVSIRQPFFNSWLGLQYGIRGLGGDNTTQQVSVQVEIDPFRDRQAPLPVARADVALFSPPGVDGLPSTVHFQLQAFEETGRINQWLFEIHHSQQDFAVLEAVFRFSGQGMPPKTLRWDGQDVAGAECPAGMYAYRLVVVDPAGNRAETVWGYVELRR